RFDKNRHEFIVRRGMLRTLLASYLGGSAAGLGFTYSAHGKPRLEEAKNPGTLTFNLSHSDGVILC
ncbi:MAG: 4'-phosphopantetheinyl transferase, partial [Acidobacteria bacterium]